MRIKSQPEKAHNHYSHHERFPRVQVGNLPGMGIWPLEGPLYHPQRIKGGGENTDAGNHRDRDTDSVRSQQYEKLSHEVTESRQTQRAQTEEECGAA